VSQPLPRVGAGVPGRSGAPVSTGDEAVNRLAAAMRRISNVVVSQDVPEAELARVAAQLTQVAEGLDALASPPTESRIGADLSGHPQDFFPNSPIIGYANPIAPPVDVWAVQGEDGRPEVRGRATFPSPYEGPPGCVHGGVIAELFDELMGVTNVVAGSPGMTGTLSVRYRKPTPLLAPLDLVARVTGTERRKTFTWAGIYHDGALTAEAEGIFIGVQSTQVQNIPGPHAEGSASAAAAASAEDLGGPEGGRAR
jgi:acyl-coenzyme A thioesterase PaaI-like protein